jgi:hypothetical protein
MPVFAAGPLAAREPELKVRRARRRAAEAHAWHGRTFKGTLARAMVEGYGVVAPKPRATTHGVYAEAIESRWPR